MTTALITNTQQSRQHEIPRVPFAQETLQVARSGYSFQTREVLQRIITAEQQRLREEQMFWKVGGAILGACLGLGNGFQVTDVFLTMGLSGLGSLSYEVMSHEDRRFLESCHALWTVGSNSPFDLLQRLGPARARIVLFGANWQQPAVFSHHQGHRGDTLVALGIAGQLAAGFQLPQSHEVMQRHFSNADMDVLKLQLYPNASVAIPVASIQAINNQQAMALDPFALDLLPATQPVRIDIEGDYMVGYRVAIPAHSDF
jgi:hypothetical protein